MRLALDDRYKIVIPLGVGCGLRQGEFFGVAPEDFDRDDLVLHVVRQVRIIDGQPVYALPKRNKTRDVPLPPSVLRLVDEHMERFPPVPVTLPWRIPSGDPVTVRLILTTQAGGPLLRSRFNDGIWAPARKRAGITHPTRQDGTHAMRHHYASVLLDAGESIKALSEYLGHHDPGFTLRTYTHLMPTSTTRTQQAIDNLFGDGGAADGPGTAHDGDAGS
jgi:integrase